MNPRLLLKLIPISQNNWFTLNLTTKNQHHFTVNMQSSEFIFSGSRLVVQLGFFQSLEFTVRQDGCAVMIIFIPQGSSEEQLIHPKSILFQRRIDPPNITTKNLYSKHPWRSIGTITGRLRGTIPESSRVQGGRKPWRWRRDGAVAGEKEGHVTKEASAAGEEEIRNEEDPCRRRHNLYSKMWSCRRSSGETGHRQDAEVWAARNNLPVAAGTVVGVLWGGS
jgi:hypothetical protein